MAMEEADPGALKRNVLHLVLQHPEGVTFGDFSAAFRQLHGYHPHLAFHGYRSLKDLVADMKNVVVLEGDSQNPVIKLASESLLYRWLEGGEEYGWDDSEEEAQNSSYDEAAEEEDAEVLELLTSLLSSYKFGLKIKRVQKFLLAKDGVDLEKFSIAQGYKDTLEFLEHRIPELTIKNPEKGLNCVVQLTADTAGEMQPPVSSSSCEKGSMAVEEADPGALKRNVLHLVLQHPEGVKFGDFSGAFKQLHGYHPHLALHGYHSLRDLVADMKNFVVLEGNSQNPVIKLASESLLYRWLEGGEEYGWDDSEEEAQSLSEFDEAAAEEDADTSAPFPSVITQGLLGKPASQAPGFSIAFVTIRDVLKCHPKGLKVKKLKEALREKYDIDLEMLRSDLGYQDIISFLHSMPGLLLRNSNAVRNCVVQLQSGPSSPAPSLDTDFSACNSNATFQEPMKKKSVGTLSSTPSLDTDSCACNSNAIPQRLMTKKSDLATAIVLVLDVLGDHPLGLNPMALKENLETKHGFDLDAFSQELGYEDVMSCLVDIPGLSISYLNGRLSQNCIIQLLPGAPVLPAWLLSASYSLDKPPSSSGSNTLCQKPMERKADSGVNSVRPLLNAPPPRIQAASSVPASCISTSTPVCAPLSVHSKPSSIKCETSNQRKVEKTPAPSEVLALLSSLLSSTQYQSGLRLKKVQELLLTKEGVDLEKFSIAQGHKDSLAFLERHMPQLKIKYQEDPLSCVLQLESGSCAQTSPPLRSAPTSLMQTTKTVLTANSVPASCISTSTPISAPLSLGSKPSSIKSETSNHRKVVKTPALSEVLALLSSLLSTSQYQSGLRLAKVQELLLTKDGVDLKRFSIAQGYKDSLAFLERHMPQLTFRYQEDPLSCVLQLGSAKAFISQNPHGAFSDKDRSSSQPPSDVSSQLSSEFQFDRPPPAEELPTLPNAQLLKRPNLTGPLHSKDLDELKQEVAHILARHPEGISLFQFRVEYSNAYQKHLPLEDASSAKQRLLQMPDVVCLKGYGVQTLLFPVSAKEPSLKSGQQIISRVEDAAVVPGPSLSKAVVDPVVVCQPSLPTAPVKPWPRTIHSLTSGHLSEPGNMESSVLPPSELLRAPNPRAPLQEHRMAKLGDPSGQSCLSHAAEAAVAPDCSLSKTDPVMVPMSSAPKATMAPVPQPRSSSHLYSECFKPPSNKESCPHPETSPRKAPKTVVPEEEREMARARPRGTPPSPPVVFPPDWGAMSDGFASSPSHQAKPWVSHKRTLTPSLSQPLPASFMTWAHPLVFPPITFLNQPVPPPSLAFQPVPVTPPRIQPPNVKPQSSQLAQAVPQMRPLWPTSPLQSTEQRNYVYAAQEPGAFSQEQMSSRTAMHAQSLSPVFVADGMPVPLPSQNPPSAHASKSWTTYQPECYRRLWLDSPQCSSISAVDNSAMTTSSARVPSQPAVYWSQSAGGNTLVTSPSTPPSHMLPVPTNVSQQPYYASSCTSTHTEALPSSALRSSPQPFQPHLSISNREPQAFTYPQQYVDVCSTVSSVSSVSSVTTRPASSLTSPLYSPTDTSGLPSYTSYNEHHYGAPNQMKPLLATSKEAENQDNHYVTWVDKQKPGRLTQRPTNSYSSAFQNSPPPKSPSKCVIL